MKPLLLFAGILVGASAMAQSGAPADVPKNHWAFEAVDNLFRAGVLKGYPDGNFRGTRPVSRFEMAGAIDAAFSRVMDATNRIQSQLDGRGDRPGTSLVSKTETEALRASLESLRLQVADMRRQREGIDSLNLSFKELNDQLQRLRGDLNQMRQDIGKVKGQ